MSLYKAVKLQITIAKTVEKLESIAKKIATIYDLDDTQFTDDEYTELVNLINAKKERLRSDETSEV